MGGLSSALALAKKGFKDIQVYETASNLGFVGAGIQLAPNMARILDRLGVWDEVAKEAVVLRNTSIRRTLPVYSSRYFCFRHSNASQRAKITSQNLSEGWEYQS